MWKNLGNEKVQATTPNTDYDRSTTTGECGIFHMLGSPDNKLFKMCRNSMVKAAFAKKKKTLFSSKLDLNLRKN
jgi:hypothetical protein